MPRTRSLAWSELKIGVLSTAAVIIAAVSVFMLTGGRGFVWERYSLKTHFPNVAGLKAGSPVRLAGLEVGAVENVELSGEQVEVTFQVNKKYRPEITTESTAVLGSISLLGEFALDLSPSSRGTPVPDGGEVRPGATAASLSDVASNAGQGITELTELLRDIRAGKGTVGKLMTDEQMYVQMNQLLATVQDLTTSIKQGKGTVGKLLNDPKAANALEDALSNTAELTRKLNAGEGSLGALLKDDSFSKSLTSTTDSLSTLLTKLNSGEGTVGKMINDSALYNRLDSVTQKVEELIARLNNGDGTMGQLLKDKQLYENMNKTMSEASGLIASLKELVVKIEQDPRKYLNVRVGIFSF